MRIALIRSVLVAALGQFGQQPVPPQEDVLCGPYCVYVASLALGMRPGNLGEFVKTLGPSLREGYTLAQLDEAARRIGLKTLPIHADLSVLARIRRPFACVAVLGSHFALIQDIDSVDETVSLIDPPRERRLPLDTFKQIYSGNMLILSPSDVTIASDGYWRYGVLASALLVVALSALAGIRAIRKRGCGKGRGAVALVFVGFALASGLAGCGSHSPQSVASSRSTASSRSVLRLDAPVLDLGKIFVDSPRQTIEGAVRLTNHGNVPITIASLKKDCACTNAVLDRHVIPAGAFAVLTTRVEVGDRSGPNRSTVTVVCANGSVPDQTFVLLWEPLTKLFISPESQVLGRLDTREPRTFRQVLRARGISLCPDCRLTAESRHGLLTAAATLNPLRAGQTHDFAQYASAGSEAREVGTLEVSVKPGGEPGDYSSGIDVGLHCGTVVRTSLFVPLTWSIRPSIELRPSGLWLGVCRVGQNIEREITITSTEHIPFQVSGVSCDVPTLLRFTSFPTVAGTSHVMRIGFRAEAAPGTHRATLTFKLAGHSARESLLPFSVLIK